jgi:hypothetical protein
MKLKIIVVSAVLLSVIGIPRWNQMGIAAEPATERQLLSGKVVSLAEVFERLDAPMDKDAAPYWLALETKEGRRYPLLKDAGARMFFKDKSLLNQTVEITGRFLKGTEVLQVFSVRTIRAGKRMEPYYWCDICKIKRFEPNLCDCCRAPLEFREDPATK